MKTRILIIFIILIPLIGLNCKKANNDEEYRKLIIGNWIHIDKCAGAFGLDPDACNDNFTFYENGYYIRGGNGHYSVYYTYKIANGKLLLATNSTYNTWGQTVSYEEYNIEKLYISSFSNKDLKLINESTGEELNLKYNGK